MHDPSDDERQNNQTELTKPTPAMNRLLRSHLECRADQERTRR
jgi:hypothetical protein